MSDQTNVIVSESEQRKLWLDYLGKLNDRASRADQASGMTTWVLLALMGTLLYSAVPRLSVLTAAVRHRTLLFLLLGFDCFFCVTAAYDVLLRALEIEYSDIRGEPSSSRSIGTLVSLLMLVSLIPTSGAHFRAVTVDQFLPKITSACLITFGWILLLVALAGVAYESRRMLIERRFSIYQPFVNRMMPPSWGVPFITVTYFLGALWCTFAATTLAFALNTGHIDWITPLTAAGYTFLLSFLTVELACRPLRRATTQNRFAELEQKILTENLASEEIKKAFAEQLIGQSLQHWLTDLSSELAKEYKERESFLSEAEQRAVDATSLQKLEERVDAIMRLISDIGNKTPVWRRRNRAFYLSLPDLRVLRPPATQRVALEPITRGLRVHFKRVKCLYIRLQRLLNQLKDQLETLKTHPDLLSVTSSQESTKELK